MVFGPWPRHQFRPRWRGSFGQFDRGTRLSFEVARKLPYHGRTYRPQLPYSPWSLLGDFIYHYEWRTPVRCGGCRDDAPDYDIYIVRIQRWWRIGRFRQREERLRERWERWCALCISWAPGALGQSA